MSEGAMARDVDSTRRKLLTGGAILAAPIAAAAVPAVALAEDSLNARVARLESENAIRDLHRAWVRQLNAGAGDARLDVAVRRIIVDHAGAPERIELAADGRSAVGHFDCVVEVETPLPDDCTLAHMARAQGSGNVCRTERRVLTVDYERVGGCWKITSVKARSLSSA